jgi:hypothetical protein
MWVPATKRQPYRSLSASPPFQAFLLFPQPTGGWHTVDSHYTETILSLFLAFLQTELVGICQGCAGIVGFRWMRFDVLDEIRSWTVDLLTVVDSSCVDRLAGVAQQSDVLTSTGASAQDLCGCYCDNIQQERQGQDRQQPGHAGSTGRSLARDGAALPHLAEQHCPQGEGRSQGKGVEPPASPAREFAQFVQHVVPPMARHAVAA